MSDVVIIQIVKDVVLIFQTIIPFTSFSVDATIIVSKIIIGEESLVIISSSKQLRYLSVFQNYILSLCQILRTRGKCWRRTRFPEPAVTERQTFWTKSKTRARKSWF